MNPEQIETFAIRAARGDDIESWPLRFTAEQKRIWRKFVLDFSKEIGDAQFKNGYAKCQEDLAASEKIRRSRSIRRTLGK